MNLENKLIERLVIKFKATTEQVDFYLIEISNEIITILRNLKYKNKKDIDVNDENKFIQLFNELKKYIEHKYLNMH